MLTCGLDSSMLGSIGQLFSVLAIFVFVLLLTYFTTRWIAGYQQNQMHNRNLRVVETLKLTNNKYIQIIEAGDVYLVIALGKDHVEKLAELTKDQLKEAPPVTNDAGVGAEETFRDVLNRVKRHLPKK